MCLKSLICKKYHSSCVFVKVIFIELRARGMAQLWEKKLKIWSKDEEKISAFWINGFQPMTFKAPKLCNPFNDYLSIKLCIPQTLGCEISYVESQMLKHSKYSVYFKFFVLIVREINSIQFKWLFPFRNTNAHYLIHRALESRIDLAPSFRIQRVFIFKTLHITHAPFYLRWTVLSENPIHLPIYRRSHS